MTVSSAKPIITTLNFPLSANGQGPIKMIAPALEETTGYEEFRIELFYDSSRETFNLRASSLAGETMITDFHSPFSLREVEEALAGITRANVQFTRSTQRSSVDVVRSLGSRLFTSISENRVGDLYQQSAGMAKERGRNLRLRFVMDHVWMTALPWEFLFDTTRLDFLTLSTRSPVVRQWGQQATPPPEMPAIEPPLRVLVAIAEVNLSDQGTGLKELEVLEHFGKSGTAMEIEVINDATPMKLLEALERKSFHVLYLIACGAHLGTGDGSLWGESAGRAFISPPQQTLLLLPDATTPTSFGSQPLEMRSLFNAISLNQKELRLVYFSGDVTDWLACETAAISPATLGWRGHNTVEAYLSFTRGFFAALVEGQPIESAVTHGRKAIDSEYPGGKEWGMPVFYMQNDHSTVLSQPKRASSVAFTSGSVKQRKVKVPNKAVDEREWKKLQVLLASAEQNYQALMEEIGKFSGQAVPDYLDTQLVEIKQTISGLTSQIKQLSK